VFNPRVNLVSSLQEWEELMAQGVLESPGGLACAFSRDQPEKVYVQHLIAQQASRLWGLINDGGALVYVAGSADKMPADVAKAFAGVIADKLQCGLDAAQKLQRQLETKRRYFVEAW